MAPIPLSQIVGKSKQPTSPVISPRTGKPIVPLSQLIQQNKPKSTFSRIFGAEKDIATGVAKSDLSLIKGTGEIAGSAVNALMGKGFTPNAPGGLQETDTAKKVFSDKNTNPQNTGETIGNLLGTAAQFLAPSGIVGEATKGVAETIDASKYLAPIAKATAKIVSKTLIEGIYGAGVTAAQTGSLKKAGIAGTVFGGLAGLSSTTGAILKSFNVPERLYSGIFRESYKDLTDVLRTGGQSALKNADPALYNEAVKAGIIKVGKDGSVTVDESLARQALNRGLKGNITNMANTVVKGLVKSELAVRQAVKGFKGTFELPVKQLTTVLQGVSQRFEGVGMDEIKNTADGFIQKLKDSEGKLIAEDTLALRRFMDRMRIESSFDQNIPKAQQQQNFKYWTDKIRGMLVDKIPGLKSVMKDYSFGMDAIESLSKAAVREGNKQVFDLMDTVLFEGGLAQGNPGLGGILSIARRMAMAPSIKTRLGQVIEQGGTISKVGALVKKGLSSIFGAGDSQNPTPMQP